MTNSAENPPQRPWTPPARQRGAALILIITALVLVLLAVITSGLADLSPRQRSLQITRQALTEAQQAVVAWAVAHPSRPGRLPLPDRNGDGAYDGLSDCSSFAITPALLLGRLPWRGEDINCQDPTIAPEPATGPEANLPDASGAGLWYAVSSNLLHDATVNPSPQVVPSLLANPNGWLTVTDGANNVISNRVAFVLLAPGPALPGQDRGGTAPPASAWLDTFNGLSNADADGRYVQVAAANGPGGTFNDQIAYVTIDALMKNLVKRALGEVSRALQQYHASFGQFPPDAAPLADGVCMAGTTSGFLPVQAGTCGNALTGLPSWINNDWLGEIGYQRLLPNQAQVTINGNNYAISP